MMTFFTMTFLPVMPMMTRMLLLPFALLVAFLVAIVVTIVFVGRFPRLTIVVPIAFVGSVPRLSEETHRRLILSYLARIISQIISQASLKLLTVLSYSIVYMLHASLLANPR
jgi:hypothetical protein